MKNLNRLAINDEGFIFDPSTGESFTVNFAGLTILKEMKENKTIPEITEVMKEQFDMAPEAVELDVIDFVTHLKTYRLV